MTERRLPLRTWLAAGVLVFAMLALVAPAEAALCPMFPEWCSCDYCATSPQCNCLLREGSPSGISCEVFYANGGCISFQDGDDMAAQPQPANDEMTLEQLLTTEESTEISAPEVCP